MTSHPKGANTPAPDTSPLDRATDATLQVPVGHASGESYRARLVRAAVAAALTNDADPDWLAQVIYESTYPGVDGLPEWDEMDPAGATRLIHGIYADAVRTAILGEDR